MLQTLLAWAGFAVGFGFRPLGAILFGYLGDRLGRKYTFLATITLMGIATAGVGLVPGYVAIGMAAPLILIGLRRAFADSKMHETPESRMEVKGKKKPPFWNRLVLIVSAMGVSFVHGSNDGQKGIGLIMLVLIGIVPAHWSIKYPIVPPTATFATKSSA